MPPTIDPILSIVMPVKNGGHTLERAIESCLEQKIGEGGAFELLLIDDGSTDGSRAVMEAAAARDARVAVLEPGAGEGGLVGALQSGIARARGELIGRMDADDVSLPGRFAAQLDYLEVNSGVAVCGCGVTIPAENKGEPLVGAGGERPAGGVKGGFREYERWMNAVAEPGAIAAQRFIESPLVHPSVVMRRADLDAVGGYREVAWAEDYDLWLRFLDTGRGIGKVPEVLLEWRDSPGRLTRTDARYSRDAFLRAKAHYLARMERVRKLGVAICGAGPTGKRLATLLRAEEVAVRCFIEVHPRRIGERIGGTPVRAREEVPSPGEAVLIGAVGQLGRREKIRELGTGAGFLEGESFFCVA